MNLHSTGIKDQKHKIICQIADIVWGEGPGGARSDPPETGVLLPGSVTYKKYVQLFAERLVAKTTPALYSDTNYTSNNARYRIESTFCPFPSFIVLCNSYSFLADF